VDLDCRRFPPSLIGNPGLAQPHTIAVIPPIKHSVFNAAALRRCPAAARLNGLPADQRRDARMNARLMARGKRWLMWLRRFRQGQGVDTAAHKNRAGRG